MKKTIIVILANILFIIILSTKPNKVYSQNDDTKIIKFMNSTSYGVDYGEQMFWVYIDEHAFMYQHAIDIKKRVCTLPKKSNSKLFKNYSYCFLVPKSKGNDTVYADYSLKSWIIKENGKNKYYYDEGGKLAHDLRFSFSFFNDCW